MWPLRAEMPRKKTVQTAPKETIDAGEFVIEIRDRDTREIGRGKDKKFVSGELNSQVLHGLVDMLLSSSVKSRKEALIYLESPRAESKLARYLQLGGYDLSDRALRQHAKDIRREWRIYRAAMSPSQLADILNPER
jgi:hypothetical protein